MIVNELGLHARPASAFVKTARRFKSDISLSARGEKVDGKSIMNVISLAAEKGTKITITAKGDDAQVAVETLVQLVNEELEGE